MHASRPLLFTLLALSALFLPSLAGAETKTLSPADIVRRNDEILFQFKDQRMDVSLNIVDIDGSEKSYDITLYQKGAKKRLIVFTNGEMSGSSVLVEDRNNVYVYLPGFKRVRRVAAHGLNQTFAGSDFTNADMSSVTWGDSHEVTLLKEDETSWYLHAVPKAGMDTYYASADLKIDKSNYWMSGVTYYDAKGVALKVMENSEPRTFAGGQARFSKIVMRDARSGHRTEMRLRDFLVNQNYPDSMFTQRQLQWGR